MLLPDIAVGKRCFVGKGRPFALGFGDKGPPYPEIRGSQYIQGPSYVGDDGSWPIVGAATMLSPLNNPESPTPFIPGALVACGVHIHNPYTLGVSGSSAFLGNVDVNDNLAVGNNVFVGNNVTAQGEVKSQCGAHVLSRKKNIPFDMEHPTKPGWRLRHVCLEGPEIGVYLHGKNKGNVLELPDYWRGLVREHTISVHLTPIGKPHVLYIEKIENNKVFIGPKGEDIEYNYVIHASRYDDDLIVEYEGESHLDYPGGNEGYSFTFENNNMERLVKEVVRERLDEMEKQNGK